MDGLELFRKLGVGAKFNFKRFQTDAERLKIKTFKSTEPKEKQQSSLIRKRPVEESDFSTSKKSRRDYSQKRDIENSDGEEDDDSDSDAASASESDQSESGSESDSEDQDNELQILGTIKAKQNEGLQRKRDKLKKQKSPAKLAAIQQEQVNHFRRQHHIHVYGSDVPDPVSDFEQLVQQYSLPSTLVENIKAAGFNSPTPIQMQALPAMLNRREILACAPTGSGKTLAFILPILHHLKQPRNQGFRALVLAPTRELAQQTHREFCRIAEGTGFRIFYIEKASTAAKKFGPDSAQKFDILVTTPNRLVYMLKQTPPIISLKNIEWLVVDESDKLFEEGKYGFRDQLAAIYQACEGPKLRRAFFSATFAYGVEEWCRLNLDNLVQVYIGARNSATESIQQELQFVGNESGKLVAMREIIRKGFTPPVLIFVQSKERAKELFHELVYDGINVDVIHSDRTQTQRENVVKGFRAGRIWVLICTELMGRGIDFKGVNLVINYDFPNSAISYIHRIGRTGRAGRAGRAVTFFTEPDSVYLRSIANVMKEAGCPVPEYMLKMKKLNKREKRKLAKSAPKRRTIRTVPLAEIKKSRKLRKNLKQNNQEPGKHQVDKSTQRDDSSKLTAKTIPDKKPKNSSLSNDSNLSVKKRRHKKP